LYLLKNKYFNENENTSSDSYLKIEKDSLATSRDRGQADVEKDNTDLEKKNDLVKNPEF